MHGTMNIKFRSCVLVASNLEVRNYPAVIRARYDSAEQSIAEIQVELRCWALVTELPLSVVSSVTLFVADW